MAWITRSSSASGSAIAISNRGPRLGRADDEPEIAVLVDHPQRDLQRSLDLMLGDPVAEGADHEPHDVKTSLTPLFRQDDLDDGLPSGR